MTEVAEISWRDRLFVPALITLIAVDLVVRATVVVALIWGTAQP